MKNRWHRGAWLVQGIMVLAIAGSLSLTPPRAVPAASELPVPNSAWLPAPLYDDDQVVSDLQLRHTLLRLQPRFAPKDRNTNFMEHALRAWKHDATFDDPTSMSGAEMVRLLTDHAQFAAEFGHETPPLVIDTNQALDVRVALRAAPHGDSASRHHDHWLSCLVESGVPLDHVIQTQHRQVRLRELFDRAVEDFRVDEREYEWSAMIFAYFLGSHPHWGNDELRRIDFDLIAKRLLRAEEVLGVCSGTHRLYALAVLVRLQQERPVLSPAVYDAVWARLQATSDGLVAAQEPDGAWNRRWAEGAGALDGRDTSDTVDKILVTGHHLEWLSIAPAELHPPRDRVVRAGQWLVRAVAESKDETIATRYSFYSHVVAALSNWRSVRPAAFLASGRGISQASAD